MCRICRPLNEIPLLLLTYYMRQILQWTKYVCASYTYCNLCLQMFLISEFGLHKGGRYQISIHSIHKGNWQNAPLCTGRKTGKSRLCWLVKEMPMISLLKYIGQNLACAGLWSFEKSTFFKMSSACSDLILRKDRTENRLPQSRKKICRPACAPKLF